MSCIRITYVFVYLGQHSGLGRCAKYFQGVTQTRKSYASQKTVQKVIINKSIWCSVEYYHDMLFLLVGVENRQTFLFFRTIWGRATCVTSDSSMSWTFRPPFIVCQEKSLFYFIQCCTKSLNIHVKTKFTNSTVDILISSIAIAINKVNTNLFSQSFCIRILRETGVLQGGLWSVLSAST